MKLNGHTGQANNITSTANEILSKYTTLAVTGAESRQSALTKCIKAFNDKGIPAFVDSAGREWTPEAYVNMCMRSTSNTMAAEAQMARCADYEIDLVEVDSHAGARPKCARDQGKIFDRANKSEKYPHWKNSSYGEPDGLLGINCGHHIYPYVEGVSIRRYFPTEDLEANDKLYKETQTQRALERSVRNQKRECMLYDQLDDKDAFEKAAVSLKAKEANLKSYVNSNDSLTYRSNRVQVVGYDKSVSASAVAANKNYQKEAAEAVAKKAQYDTIKTKANNLGIKGALSVEPTSIDVTTFTFDDTYINTERDHNITRSEAISYMDNAKYSLTKWNGQYVNYYSDDGAVFIDTKDNNIRTAFSSTQYDSATQELMKEVKKYE